METTVVKPITDRNEWEGYIASNAEANFLQSWQWGTFHQTLRKNIRRVGFYRANVLEGIILSIVERARRATYLTVAGGPLINWQDKTTVTAFVNEIKKQAKENNCSFIRVRPQLIDSDFSRQIFQSYGFVKAPMHLHAQLTIQLDITQSPEQLLAQMRKTTRYEIRKAMKQGVTVINSKDTALLKELYAAQKQTATRRHFVPFSFEFLSKQFEIFAKENCSAIFKAKIKNQPLAYAFIIFYGQEAIYHYGASLDEGKKWGGAYLVQWHAILEAKRRGMKRYNFWGVAPDNPSHRFYNLSVFKRGFGGHEVSYLPAHDLVINYPAYFLNYLVEILRKKIRNL